MTWHLWQGVMAFGAGLAGVSIAWAVVLRIRWSWRRSRLEIRLARALLAWQDARLEEERVRKELERAGEPPGGIKDYWRAALEAAGDDAELCRTQYLAARRAIREARRR